MKRAPSGKYPGEIAFGGRLFVATGEFREPKRGEFFLSGAVIAAYRAPNGLGTKYWIAEPFVWLPHSEHAVRSKVSVLCTAVHTNFDGGCLNCGWEPKPKRGY